MTPVVMLLSRPPMVSARCWRRSASGRVVLEEHLRHLAPGMITGHSALRPRVA